MHVRFLAVVLLLPLSALWLPASAQIAEARVTEALATLSQMAALGDASPLYARLACVDEEAVMPCVYNGDTRLEDTGGALLKALREALPPSMEWLPDAITTRTVEGYALTEVQVKVRQDGSLVGQPVFLFADHDARPLLVQVNSGPSMLLADAPEPTPSESVLDLAILRSVDLSVQLPARTMLLQQMASGNLPAADAPALLACRMATTEGTAPIPCDQPRAEGDPAERVEQTFQELAFVFGDARVTPRTESVVVPNQIEGFSGAQVQFVIEKDGMTRRPTLFFLAHGDTYLYVSAHPDMDPFELPVPDAQPRLEALLPDLLGWIQQGDAVSAAPHLVYRGDGPDRWKRALDPADADDLAAAEESVRQLARIVGAYDRYAVNTYVSDTESEGTWHVLEVEFSTADEANTVMFAFLLIDDVFVLGDID